MLQDVENYLAGLPSWTGGLANLLQIGGGLFVVYQVIKWCWKKVSPNLPQISRYMTRRAARRTARKMAIYNTALQNNTLSALVAVKLMIALIAGAVFAVTPWIWFGQNSWLEWFVSIDKIHSPIFVYSYTSVMMFAFAITAFGSPITAFVNTKAYKRRLMRQLITLLAEDWPERDDRVQWMQNNGVLPGYEEALEYAEKREARKLARKFSGR